MKDRLISPETAELIQQFLNVEEKDVPEENRKIFNFLKPSIDEYLLSILPEVEIK